jgi:hypothetical protein
MDIELDLGEVGLAMAVCPWGIVEAAVRSHWGVVFLGISGQRSLFIYPLSGAEQSLTVTD